MPMSLTQKKLYVESVKNTVDSSLSVVLVENKGISSPDVVRLREDARKAGVNIKTSKNRLTKLVFKDSKFEVLNDELTGPVMLFFSHESPGDAAKVLKGFENDRLEVKALCLGAEKIAASELDRVSKLPNKLEAIALLMSAMQAPVRSLATVMQETYGSLARVLKAVSEQKQSN